MVPSASPWALKTPLCPSISIHNLAAVVRGVDALRFSIYGETHTLIPAVILDSGAGGRAYFNRSFQHDIVALVHMPHAPRSILQCKRTSTAPPRPVLQMGDV
jgi:hypothetical protein